MLYSKLYSPSGSSVQEEDDFDQFLESVKARQLSITSIKGNNHS